MKRRTALTTLGMLALGGGTALGTGAVDVVSSNANGSFRVVSPGADIEITPASSTGSNVITGDTIDFTALEPNDLPVATVNGNNGQMVTIQVAVTATQDVDFGDILTITNNNADGTDYEVAFDYTGFGADVGATIPTADVVDAFEFRSADDTIISSDSTDSENDPTNFVTVSTESPETVSLRVNQTSTIANAVASGSFAGDSESTVLIDEVTAVANQL
ncbi:hypothetical protein [Haloferax profundi]|uniref:DUF1102 domain-containing protein n=1 Tax=Haloferax profundi TaxID=1544718 RepID=A0A0W1SVL4_9EURY|nr:hypothetical protein [Haloferax profundi]KTG30386.1 hypothetical protein AUR66_08130 [Haloferax profundi]